MSVYVALACVFYVLMFCSLVAQTLFLCIVKPLYQVLTVHAQLDVMVLLAKCLDSLPHYAVEKNGQPILFLVYCCFLIISINNE